MLDAPPFSSRLAREHFGASRQLIRYANPPTRCRISNQRVRLPTDASLAARAEQMKVMAALRVQQLAAMRFLAQEFTTGAANELQQYERAAAKTVSARPTCPVAHRPAPVMSSSTPQPRRHRAALPTHRRTAACAFAAYASGPNPHEHEAYSAAFNLPSATDTPQSHAPPTRQPAERQPHSRGQPPVDIAPSQTSLKPQPQPHHMFPPYGNKGQSTRNADDAKCVHYMG